MQSTLSESKQVGFFPCRGSVVPCCTLSLVSETCPALSNQGFCGEWQLFFLKEKDYF
jgi:hypothetical protein